MSDDEKCHPAEWCVHYRGISDRKGGFVDSCHAGVSYSAWRTKETRPHQPCFLDKSGNSKPNALPCEKLRRPTPDEIAANEKSWERRKNNLVAALTVIAPWRKANKGKSASDVIECPICKGRLHLAIAASNGHVHANCDTAGCVSWME